MIINNVHKNIEEDEKTGEQIVEKPNMEIEEAEDDE